jgi:hypothetical protein
MPPVRGQADHEPPSEQDPAPGKAALNESEEPVQPRVLLHMPVDVRSASMAAVALLLGLYTLHWAAAVVIPLLLGLMFSYALSPAVDALERWRVPRWIGAALMVLAVVGGSGPATRSRAIRPSSSKRCRTRRTSSGSC